MELSQEWDSKVNNLKDSDTFRLTLKKKAIEHKKAV